MMTDKILELKIEEGMVLDYDPIYKIWSKRKKEDMHDSEHNGTGNVSFSAGRQLQKEGTIRDFITTLLKASGALLVWLMILFLTKFFLNG